MNHDVIHADDKQLQILLTVDEDSAEYRAAAMHVETCEECQKRLSIVAGPKTIDSTAGKLLSDYPWEDLISSHSDDISTGTEPNWDSQLEFLSPPSHPEMLGRLGRYEIERVIGSGGIPTRPAN